ncbi:7TM chemoreceptor, partial [Ostertagia ostertagi]
MNSSQFAGIFGVYEKHVVYFQLQRDTMLFYGIATDVVITFVLYVMKTSSIELLKAFRILMYCNVAIPALLCNLICILFVPYIMLPYPVILNLGPLRINREVTLLFSAMICWLGACAVLSIAYSIALNYISVCHFWLLRSRAFLIVKWTAFLLPAVVIVAFSIVLPYLILSDTQSVPSMLIADPRNAVFLDEFATMVVYLRSLGVDLCLIFLLLIYTGAAIIGTVMITRVVLRIRARKHEFSTKTYRLHINVVIALIMYCAILFVQLGLPVMLFVITVFFDLSWMTE